MSKFRIEVAESKLRRWLYSALLLVFLASVWSWDSGVFPYQIAAQLLLSVIIVVYFIPKIMVQQPRQVLLLHEDGTLTFLQPASDIAWRITKQSRFNGYWHWIALKENVLNADKHFLLFKDSVSDENWRHLCRVVNQVIRAGKAHG